jgi:hypothetical protein
MCASLPTSPEAGKCLCAENSASPCRMQGIRQPNNAVNINNGVMASKPGHPLWDVAIAKMKARTGGRPAGRHAPDFCAEPAPKQQSLSHVGGNLALPPV